jgi:hypothetical protein
MLDARCASVMNSEDIQPREQVREIVLTLCESGRQVPAQVDEWASHREEGRVRSLRASSMCMARL